ncbi:MAG: Holliday junction branch migration protein RuvA [Candidatus Nomurabacteria bacterium]|jgi:Holliday junction DNA helicase RuvA|nr:Holliday junction branch migration protein RuvA [Candidatus Nomurabacteria bacterium]
MIASIKGVIAEKSSGRAVVDVGGVGYEVNAPASDLDKIALGDEVKFHTRQIVRENSDELFGFLTLAAKNLFELIITVQGVGPRAALAILSLDESLVVRGRIAAGDSAFVARAAGVGKKTAEKIVVILKDKVGAAGNLPGDSAGGVSVPAGDEALDALLALGFNLSDAAAALQNVDRNLPTAERVKLALKDSR